MTCDPEKWPSGRPCGVPPAFHDLDDYLEAVLDTWVPLVERNGEALALSSPRLSAREFTQAPAVCASTAAGDIVQITPEPSDIITFAHHLEFDARLCPAHGTVESRISCAQPPGAAVEAAAFALGLVENLADAERLIEGLPHHDQKRLRIAGAFWERLATRTTHADEDISLFQTRGIQGLWVVRLATATSRYRLRFWFWLVDYDRVRAHRKSVWRRIRTRTA
ncbi:MAG: hypothetical protein ACLP0J_28810 [Solirubrobacteraceae bacterium]